MSSLLSIDCSPDAHGGTQIILQDDHLPMLVQNTAERDAVLTVVWLSSAEQAELVKYVDYP